MRNRVAIAIAKREREKLGKVETPVPTTKKTTKKVEAVVAAPVVPEAAEEMIAEDPKTLEEPGG